MMQTAVLHRRHRILDAAVQLFATASFDAVQVDEIARAARVAKPTLYRYFATKESLFVEAIERALVELKQRVAAIAAGPEAPAERLRAIISVMFGEIGRLKAMIRASESGTAPKRGEAGRALLRRELKELRAQIAGVIRSGIATGAFAPVDPDLAAMVMLGGVRMAADDGSDDPARSVAMLLLHGLAGPRASAPDHSL
jgi:AcrR family transcriptional regulator